MICSDDISKKKIFKDKQAAKSMTLKIFQLETEIYHSLLFDPFNGLIFKVFTFSVFEQILIHSLVILQSFAVY